ncbi:toll/interleukin-1 receptor domain-containing protein [Paludisphaera soli]|uniref:toll/interleukin-1 receptor domain-containing protein n=1 Tax=Paludisphaera soli TaxID=2712865 RepID=UPI0013EB2D51|nr:toll/interleukin-1 receptor domain-containing protein [Paludisphaera soli]
MGYLHDDAPDLFISYSHADDQTYDEARKPGWVTSLSRLLRKEIDRKLGKVGACDLWMDHRLAAGDAVDASLHAKISGSATMLIVLSEGYLRSSWCQREMELFLETDAKRRHGEASRIFVVETDRVERPKALEMVLSLPFWSAHPDAPATTTQLGHPRPNEDDPDHKPFFSRLNSLTHAVVAELKRLDDSKSSGPDKPQLGPAAKAKVYLARCTDDVDDQYLEVREYLLQQGLHVVPQGDYPQEESRYIESARRDLDDSLLFVQLLGLLPGRKLAGSKRRHVGAQHELAIESGRQILRWRSRKLAPGKVEDAEQAARLAEPDVLALDLEEFKALVLQRIGAILNPPPPPPERPGGQGFLNKLVFINADSPDLEMAERLGRLLEQMGAWVSLPYSGDKDQESNPRTYMTEQLGECDIFLIIYGDTKAKWVSSQLLWSRKPLAQREVPAALAVIEMPPTPKEPLSLLVPRLKFLKGQPLPTMDELVHYLRSV